jgi:hypothetical protein
VRTGTGTSESVELGALAPDGTAIARRADDGAVLSLSRAAARRFEPHPVALRGRLLWQPPFDAASVVGVDETCGKTRQTLVLVDHRWMSGRVDVDPVAAAEMTQIAAHARAEAWVTENDDGGFGFDSPGACTVRLRLAGVGPVPVARAHSSPTNESGRDDLGRTVALSFGATGDGGIYARVDGDPAVFVAPTALRETFRGLGDSRSRARLDAALPGGP